MTSADTTTPDTTVLEPPVLYFGTPVSLVGTRNPDGTSNLAPMSSSWYLGHTVVLGVAECGQTLANLRREGECTINLPDVGLHPAVERLAPLTGRDPVPAHKPRHRFEPDKFGTAGLTAVAADLVDAPRVAECQVQLEAEVQAVHGTAERGFAIVETQVRRVHVDRRLVVPGTQHVDTARWRPLFYVFRHYFGLGDDRGRSFRADH